jgi:hypothetical protein
MKKALFLTVFSLHMLISRAQNSERIFNPMKVDVSLGGAIPQGAGDKGGGLFVVEPKYAVADQFWVGLRIEAAVTARALEYSDGTASSTNVGASVSYLITGDYYFTTTNFRPFIGAGAGLFRLASASVDDFSGNSSEIASATKFGEMLRVGFELNHFRFGVEYNLVGNTNVNSFDANGDPITAQYKNNYVGIKAGFVFGGNRY